jgi:hypothetical protein
MPPGRANDGSTSSNSLKYAVDAGYNHLSHVSVVEGSMFFFALYNHLLSNKTALSTLITVTITVYIPVNVLSI